MRVEVYKVNNKIIWVVWLLLMIIWNYSFPDALPYEDVFVAVILSVIVKKLERVMI
jgi:hypothetical protein|tara:strand:- start:221 stop:388 length:168 start_codon:yes stop_codon:yes gene_type:complete